MSSKRRTTPESQADKDAADKNTTDKNVVDNNAAVKNAADNIADKKAADNNAAYKNIADKNVADKKSLFVFGYGSLLWYTDFDYDTCTAGYINGFVRRFWQQSETHRGTAERKGRVVTLAEEKEALVYGLLFTVTGKERIEQALQVTRRRETKLGGYIETDTLFYPKNDPGNPVKVTVFIATPSNPLYDAEHDLEKLADQIACAHGSVGPNTEYVFKLEKAFKENFPEQKDEHLFRLADILRERHGVVVKRINGNCPCFAFICICFCCSLIFLFYNCVYNSC